MNLDKSYFLNIMYSTVINAAIQPNSSLEKQEGDIKCRKKECMDIEGLLQSKTQTKKRKQLWQFKAVRREEEVEMKTPLMKTLPGFGHGRMMIERI